jgi:hypothetical protein
LGEGGHASPGEEDMHIAGHAKPSKRPRR